MPPVEIVLGPPRPLLADAAARLAARQAATPLSIAPLVAGLNAARALARLSPAAAAGALQPRDLAQRLLPGVRLAGRGELLARLADCRPRGANDRPPDARLLELILRIRLWRPAALPGDAGSRYLEWADRLDEALQAAGAADEAALYERAAARAEAAPALAAVGFDDLHPGQIRLFAALAAAGRLASLHIPSLPGEAAPPWLAAVAPGASPRQLAGDAPAPVEIVSVADRAAAARFVAARALARGGEPPLIALPSRDPGWRAALASAFARAHPEREPPPIRLPARSDGAGAAGDAIAALLELPAADFPPAALERLLTGPCAADRETGLAFTRALRVAGALDRARGAPLARKPDFAASVIPRLYAELPRDEAPLAAPEFAARLEALLDAALRVREESADAEALAALADGLAELRALPGARPWREWADIVASEWLAAPYEPPPPDAARADDWSGLRLALADELYVLGLSEGAWTPPAPPYPPEWLPALGYADLAASGARRLAMLRAQAARVTLVVPRLEEGTQAWPHPFVIDRLCELSGAETALGPLDGKENRDAGKTLERWFMEPPSPGEARPVAWLADGGEGLPAPPLSPAAERTLLRERRRRFGSDAAHAGAVPRAAAHPVSPTLLEDWGRCPFQAFGRILGIREEPEEKEATDGDRREIGIAVHAVLRAFYDGGPEGAWDGRWGEAARARLRELLAARCADLAADGGPPLLRGIEAARIGAWLERRLAEESSRLAGRAPDGESEFLLASPDRPAPFLGGPPALARADRLERGPLPRLIDYKTGAPRPEHALRRLDQAAGWQAPFYLAAAAAGGEAIGRFEFAFLPSAREEIVEAGDPRAALAIATLPAAAREAIGGPFHPRPGDPCERCELQDACGKEWRAAESWDELADRSPARAALRAGVERIKADEKSAKSGSRKGGAGGGKRAKGKAS